MVAAKATRPAAPDLALHALAQARAEEVQRVCAKTCGDCPGPGEPGGCETRKVPPVAGRAAWPVCPMAMLRAPTWREIVDRFVLSRVSPHAADPARLTAFAVDGLVELHSAVRREDERVAKEASNSSGGPHFTGRRVTRPGG